MKRLINLILILLLTITVNAQNKSSYDYILDSDKVLVEYRAKAKDTVSTNQQTFTYTIFNEGQNDLKAKFISRWSIALDSVSGTAADVKVEYQKRMNIFTTWSTDSTAYFAGSTSDTTMIFYDATARPEPYRRIKVTYASGFKVKIDWLAGLFLKD